LELLIYLIVFEISEELKSIISEFHCYNNGAIKLTFMKTDDELSFSLIFAMISRKSLFEIKKSLKKIVRKHFNWKFEKYLCLHLLVSI
jgi:hypothetical protein